jgi:Alkylmercury lyase
LQTTKLSSVDLEARRVIYDRVMNEGAIPTRSALAKAMQAEPTVVTQALARLAEAHMLVLQADGEILMANPFSAVPTPFVVLIDGRSWYGNCIWDSMGIAAMMNKRVLIETSCGDCGTSLKFSVPDDCTREEWVAHFAIPAAHWWDDIVFN